MAMTILAKLKNFMNHWLVVSNPYLWLKLADFIIGLNFWEQIVSLILVIITVLQINYFILEMATFFLPF